MGSQASAHVVTVGSQTRPLAQLWDAGIAKDFEALAWKAPRQSLPVVMVPFSVHMSTSPMPVKAYGKQKPSLPLTDATPQTANRLSQVLSTQVPALQTVVGSGQSAVVVQLLSQTWAPKATSPTQLWSQEQVVLSVQPTSSES